MTRRERGIRDDARGASGKRDERREPVRGRRDAKPRARPASPPSAMPVSTTPSISASASEWPLTKSSRKRNHTTSRARRQNPERKAAVSQRDAVPAVRDLTVAMPRDLSLRLCGPSLDDQVIASQSPPPWRRRQIQCRRPRALFRVHHSAPMSTSLRRSRRRPRRACSIHTAGQAPSPNRRSPAPERFGEQGQRDPHRGGRNQQQEERHRESNRIEHPRVIQQRPQPWRQRRAEDREEIDEPDARHRDRDFSDRVGPHRIADTGSVSCRQRRCRGRVRP